MMRDYEFINKEEKRRKEVLLPRVSWGAQCHTTQTSWIWKQRKIEECACCIILLPYTTAAKNQPIIDTIDNQCEEWIGQVVFGCFIWRIPLIMQISVWRGESEREVDAEERRWWSARYIAQFQCSNGLSLAFQASRNARKHSIQEKLAKACQSNRQNPLEHCGRYPQSQEASPNVLLSHRGALRCEAAPVLSFGVFIL